MRICHFYFVLLTYAKVQTSDKLDKLEERNTHFQEKNIDHEPYSQSLHNLK